MSATVGDEGRTLTLSGCGADVVVNLQQLGAVAGDASRLGVPTVTPGSLHTVACYAGQDVGLASAIGWAFSGVKVAWGAVFDPVAKVFKTDIGVGGVVAASLMEAVWPCEHEEPQCGCLTIVVLDERGA